MHSISEFTIECGRELLAGTKILPSHSTKAHVLFLHGAGTSNQQRALPLAQYLADEGRGVVTFDFSGHGKSSGSLAHSSLAQRTQEALTMWKTLDESAPRSIVAFSMGGHVALELLGLVPVENLVLFYPAVYDAACFKLAFDSGFTECIRRPESWRQATVVTNLRHLAGNLLVVIGSEDPVIPNGVISMLEAAAAHAQGHETVRIEGAGHMLLETLLSTPGLREDVFYRVRKALPGGPGP